MSEYQYYEFISIDRPLTKTEIEKVDSWSSRARVSAHSAIFTYSYGDFRQDEEKALAAYFDMMFYTANWGSKRLMFRFPKDAIDAAVIKKYCNNSSDYLRFWLFGDYYLLDIHLYDDDGDGFWIDEDTSEAASLLPLRAAILTGDYRCLYMAWLYFSVQSPEDIYSDDEDDYDEEDGDGPNLKALEPPVPANLDKLDSALDAFAYTFLGLEDALLAAAAEASPKAALKSEFDEKKMLAAIKTLPEELKNNYLLRLAQNEPSLSAKLLKLLQTNEPKGVQNTGKARTIGEILNRSLKIEHEMNKKVKEEWEKTYKAKMVKIKSEEETLWKSVEFNISQKKKPNYKIAVDMLKDLKELAVYENRFEFFVERLNELTIPYRNLVIMSDIKQAKIFIKK